MSKEENLSLQADEVEALAAIYGDEWCEVDREHKIYCIQVTDGQERSTWSVCIQVHMPENYPLEAPPEYQINAPWLRGEEKRNLESALADLYCENIGVSIVYLWVEKIRELLQNKLDDKHSDQQAQSGRAVVMTTETEDGDDDFDLSDLDLMSVSSGLSDTGSESGEASDWECPAITHGDCVTDRRSTFQPHLAPVFHKSQVKMVLDRLCENKKVANATHNILAYRIVTKGASNNVVYHGYDDDGETHAGSRKLHLMLSNVKMVLDRLCENKKIANATHNILAYRIVTKCASNNVMYHGCDDDGETHAGSRMLHLMQILDVQNVMVVVSRWYGGIHLGPDRFKHINNCTRVILEQAGYIKDKDEKKGPKSSDKKKR